MTLITLEDARQRFEEAVAADVSHSSELLRPSSLEESDLNRMERALNVKLPEGERRLMLRHELNEFAIGYVGFGFGNTDNYATYLEMMNGQEYTERIGNAWWWPGDRPPNRILVADADAWAILLDTSTSAILAFLDGTHHTTAQIVARDLEHFIRGVATVRLDFADSDRSSARDARVTALAGEVGATAGGREFWRDLVFQQHG